MTHDEATGLAVRISQIWPRGGIATDIWVEELKRLRWPQANSALRKLKHTAHSAPSLAAFYAEYHAQEPSSAPVVPCDRCDGSGWVEVADDRRHGPRCTEQGTDPDDPGDCHCSAVEPCECVNGKACERTWHRITGTTPTPTPDPEGHR